MKMNQSMLYMRYLSLVVLLLVSFVSFGQAPSNYTNINGRYRWIAGMFDSTFHIPKGSTPSLRTGGSTNAGALFYKTGDSSLYIYTGTQWLKIAGAAGFVPYSGATQNVNLGIYDILAKSATIADTGGTAATITQRTSINTDMALYAKAVGNRGFAAIIEQADSNATGTQYQTIFRKSMMPGTGNPAPGAGVSWYTQISNDNNNNPAVSVYRARIIDSTGYASGLINQTSTEFWTRKNNVWDTTLVLNGGNVGINTGQNGIDSALTVANGTWLKRGVRMSALPTGVGTKALRIDANGNVSTTDTTATTGYVPYTGATQDLDMGTFSVNAKSFHIKGTAGQGHLGLKHQTATPSISANESGVYADVNGDLGLKNDNLYTSIFKTSLNSADRTYTFQNKSYTIADSADVAAKIGGTLISGYLTKATGTNTIDTSQIYQNNGRIGISTISPQTRLMVAETASDGALSILGNASNVGTFKFYANNGSTIQSVVNSSSSAMQIGTFVNSEMNLITNSATRVSILNNGNVGIGSGAATDSMLTVENGARFKRGVRMSGLPTGTGTKSLRVDANGTVSLADTLANGISGTGTTNYIPKFTSSSAIGNSDLLTDGSGNLAVAQGNAPTQALNIYRAGSTQTVMSAGNSNTGLNGTFFGVDANGNGIINTTGAFANIFSTNGSERMRLTSGGLLGLGTSSPSNKLTVQVSAGQDAINWNDGARNGYLYVDGAGVGVFSGAGATNQGIYLNNTSSYLAAFTSGSERMRLDASGNLGLGTSNPSYKLDVNTVGGSSATARLYGNDQSNVRLRLENVNGRTWEIVGGLPGANNNNFSIYDVTASTTRMTLDASGNLGLGVTNPATLLQLSYQSSATELMRLSVSYPDANAKGAIRWHDGTGTTAQIDNRYNGTVTSLNFGNFYDPNQGGYTTSTVMSIMGNGRVGIGTTSPTTKLQVDKSSQTIGGTTPNGALVVSSLAAGNGILELGVDPTSLAYIQSRNIADNTLYQLLLNPSGGNVGIGTTSPTFAGGGGLQINTSGTDTRLHLTNTTTGITGIDGFELALVGNDIYYDSKESSGSQIFYTAGSERMRITSAGNVGIGTTSPSTLLYAKTTGDGYNMLTIEATGGDAGIALKGGSGGSSVGGWTIQSQNAGSMVFVDRNSTPAERMRITTGGEVVVNGTTPIYTAANRGNITLSGTSGILSFSISSANSGYVYHTGTNMELWNTANGYLLFATNNTERMRITSGGELLINTTSDAGDFKLQVNGNVYQTGNLLLTNGGDPIITLESTNTGTSQSPYIKFIRSTTGSARQWWIGTGIQGGTDNSFSFYDQTGSTERFRITTAGNGEFGGSIKTAAPSGGTAAAWKLGERVASAGVTFNDQQYIQLDIGGTLYYLATVDLPMPEAYPQATSGPSNNYKMAPVQVKTTRDAEIEKLRKEIEELKQLIKNK